MANEANVKMTRELYGPSHPRMAECLHNYGITMFVTEQVCILNKYIVCLFCDVHANCRIILEENAFTAFAPAHDRVLAQIPCAPLYFILNISSSFSS